jgi:hypothetical protein
VASRRERGVLREGRRSRLCVSHAVVLKESFNMMWRMTVINPHSESETIVFDYETLDEVLAAARNMLVGYWTIKLAPINPLE